MALTYMLFFMTLNLVLTDWFDILYIVVQNFKITLIWKKIRVYLHINRLFTILFLRYSEQKKNLRLI